MAPSVGVSAGDSLSGMTDRSKKTAHIWEPKGCRVSSQPSFKDVLKTLGAARVYMTLCMRRQHPAAGNSSMAWIKLSPLWEVLPRLDPHLWDSTSHWRWSPVCLRVGQVYGTLGGQGSCAIS